MKRSIAAEAARPAARHEDSAYAAVKGIPFRGMPPTPPPLRLPVQAVYVAVVWWSSVADPAARGDRR